MFTAENIVSLIKNNAPGPFAKDDYDAAGQTLGTWLVGDLLVILDGVQTVVDLTTKVTIMPATTAASITRSTSIHITGSIITSTVWIGTGTPSLPDATIGGTSTVYVLYGLYMYLAYSINKHQRYLFFFNVVHLRYISTFNFLVGSRPSKRWEMKLKYEIFKSRNTIRKYPIDLRIFMSK